MSEPTKKKRIRAADLQKTSRCVGEPKYEFSKILELKGATGRDVSIKGRPQGITSVPRPVAETSTTNPIDAEVDAEQEHNENVELGSFNQECRPELENDEIYLNLLKENCGIFCTDNLYKTFFGERL